MQQPKIDLVTIAIAAEKKEDENYRFRTFLKGIDETEIDEIVFSLNSVISGQIDCTACGNCCRSLMISISSTERKVFTDHFGLPETEAEEKYLAKGLGGDTIMSNMPCVFLEGNKCSIYESRFNDCRQFPHLDQPGFVKRMFMMIHNAGICPIIFNVMEELKDKLDFKKDPV